jgi:glutamate racemase
VNSPIGVFDSGVGGLSILQALQKHLPAERFVYLADSAHAPYGERDSAFVRERARHVLDFMRQQHAVKALVVACNTATALAIQDLRSDAPDMPILGVEPAIKPAAACSKTKRVGVMATPATLQSEKFQTLLNSLSNETTFVLQGCEGLAEAIEQQWQHSDDAAVRALCEKHVRAMGVFGTRPGQLDTLVLGCTHYPFAMGILRGLVGEAVEILETGEPVARQTFKVLSERGLLKTGGFPGQPPGGVVWVATGDDSSLQHAARMWLQA